VERVPPLRPRRGGAARVPPRRVRGRRMSCRAARDPPAARPSKVRPAVPRDWR
jgi:hypothetical protein